MIWWVLSIPVGVIVTFRMLSTPSVPTQVAWASGGLLTLVCLLIGIREQSIKAADRNHVLGGHREKEESKRVLTRNDTL